MKLERTEVKVPRRSKKPEPSVLENKEKRYKPRRTLSGQENQLISWAYDQAAHDLKNKKASQQVLLHFLKLGTTHLELQKLKLQHEIGYLESRKRLADSEQSTEEMFKNAIEAMTRYRGSGGDND